MGLSVRTLVLGSVFIACPLDAYASTPTAAVEIEKLFASDASADARFGRQVALANDVLFVSAEESAIQAPRGGVVYLFHRQNGQWVEAAQLLPSDPTGNAHFGQCLAFSVSGSAEHLAIAAPSHNGPGESGQGQIYVFEKTGSEWTEIHRIVGSDSNESDFLGWALGISGASIVAGAPFKEGFGAAYVFEFNGVSWTETTRLFSDAFSDRFGWSVEIEGDWLFVGDRGDDERALDAGAVHVYRRSGSTWTFSQKLMISDAIGEELLGSAIDAQLDTLIVGADSGIAGSPGKAYVFRLEGDVWIESQILTGSGTPHQDAFGSAVSIRGETAVIGAFGNDERSPAGGAAHLFDSSSGSWLEVQKLYASTSAPTTRGFGYSAAIADECIIVGTVTDDEIAPFAGAAFVFLRGETVAGIVNTGDGSCPSDVLFVNGSAGTSKNLVTVDSGVPSTISVERAPQGNGAYAFWIYDFRRYAGAQIQYRKGGTIYELGSGVKALPINNSVTPGSVPCPLTFPIGWTSQSLGSGAAGTFCLNSQPGFPRAPTSFQAIFPPGNFIVGGLVTDQNSINSPALNVSIANWIFVRSR